MRRINIKRTWDLANKKGTRCKLLRWFLSIDRSIHAFLHRMWGHSRLINKLVTSNLKLRLPPLYHKANTKQDSI